MTEPEPPSPAVDADGDAAAEPAPHLDASLNEEVFARTVDRIATAVLRLPDMLVGLRQTAPEVYADRLEHPALAAATLNLVDAVDTARALCRALSRVHTALMALNVDPPSDRAH